MNKSGLKIVEFMIHDKQYLESNNKSRDLIFFKREKRNLNIGERWAMKRQVIKYLTLLPSTGVQKGVRPNHEIFV